MTELECCPHCGSPDVCLHEVTNYRDYAFKGILCNGCDTFLIIGKNDEHRIELWNRRAPIPEPYPCSECEKVPTPKYTEGRGWSLGCCKTQFYWYGTREEAIRTWNRQWKNRKAREIKEDYDSLVTKYREEMGLEDDE